MSPFAMVMLFSLCLIILGLLADSDTGSDSGYSDNIYQFEEETEVVAEGPPYLLIVFLWA